MAAATVEGALRRLGQRPSHFADCCAGISWPLLEALAARLPGAPALVLSIGCGRGLLEALLLRATDAQVNVAGVEVACAVTPYLPDARLLRVPRTASTHPAAARAAALLFVYPRSVSLIARYLEGFSHGALALVVWLGHRSDWPDVEAVLRPACGRLERVEGPGLPDYEVLVFASALRVAAPTASATPANRCSTPTATPISRGD